VKWDWSKFQGSQACLKWARRDLETLVRTLHHVPARRACVQAGGNLGIFPKRLAAEFDIVYTFEPEQRLFQMMCANAPETNIIKVMAALGCDNKPVRMECKRRDDSGRAVHEGLTHVAGSGTVPCLQLDDFQLQVCDLIYLDVEGWEYFALQGAAQTIRRCRPVIGVEVNRNITFAGQTPEQLRAYIKSFDYELRFSMHSDEIYCPT
jgi:FkbM family methyltransferase